jgi:predicted secreted hydrolase
MEDLPPLTLPADESPHDYQTEWWYFNAHLTDDKGERYALHDVLFQVQDLATKQTLYVRQIGLAQASTDTHVSGELVRLASEPINAEPGHFDLNVSGSIMSGSNGETYHLTGSTGAWSYDLTLTSTAPPLLHDEDGLVDFQEAGITYYYSRPRLQLTGTLSTPAGERQVTGLAWLDKQWGNFQPVVVYWDWASVQLDDGTDLMVSNLRNRRQEPIDRYVTLRRPGEDEVRIGGDGFTFEPLDETWQSDATGTRYNTHWRLTVPGEDLDVMLDPLVEESEFASRLLGVVYWEAGAVVVDTESGERLGQGFIELNWARTESPIIDIENPS